MKINIPEQAWNHFWEEPSKGAVEFWGFRFKPKCQIGDEIIFLYNRVPVAKAVVARIGRPGGDECSATGRFKNLWKVYWTQESFHEISTPEAVALRM